MKFQVSQKLLCFGDDFAIRDQNGQEVYYVDGKALSFRKKLSFLDKNKQEVILLTQKFFSKGFIIKRNGSVIATVRRKRFCVRPQFVLTVSKKNKYEVIGDLVGHEYTIKLNSENIARVSKQFFAMSDSYGVDITGGEPIFVLAAVIIVDLTLHGSDTSKKP